VPWLSPPPSPPPLPPYPPPPPLPPPPPFVGYVSGVLYDGAPALQIGAENLKSFNASIDSLSEIPFYVEEGPIYVSILGGIYFVKIEEVRTRQNASEWRPDVAPLVDAVVTYGWNYYSTAELFGFNYT
jgi:hypothetical protein